MFVDDETADMIEKLRIDAAPKTRAKSVKPKGKSTKEKNKGPKIVAEWTVRIGGLSNGFRSLTRKMRCLLRVCFLSIASSLTRCSLARRLRCARCAGRERATMIAPSTPAPKSSLKHQQHFKQTKSDPEFARFATEAVNTRMIVDFRLTFVVPKFSLYFERP